MKKFQFSLASVQRYKEQRLDLVKQEYALAQQAVAEQKMHVEMLQETFRQANHDLKVKNETGTSINELNHVKRYLIALQDHIDEEIIKLAKLEEAAEKVKQRMIAAKQETASLDILREKREGEYRAAVQKSEDAFIEEFISSRMHRS